MGREIVYIYSPRTYCPLLTYKQSTQEPERCHSSRSYNYRSAANATVFKCTPPAMPYWSCYMKLIIHTVTAHALLRPPRHRKNIYYSRSRERTLRSRTLPYTRARTQRFRRARNLHRARQNQEFRTHATLPPHRLSKSTIPMSTI